jgi:hypothetical protein
VPEQGGGYTGDDSPRFDQIPGSIIIDQLPRPTFGQIGCRPVVMGIPQNQGCVDRPDKGVQTAMVELAWLCCR